MPNLTNSQQAFLNQIERDAQARADQEQQAKDQAQLRRRDEIEARGLNLAGQAIGELPELYKQRFDLVFQLAPLLDALWQNQVAIREKEGQAFALLRESSPNAPDIWREKYRALRHEAGLPPSDESGLPDPTTPGQVYAASVFWGTFSGKIQPGLFDLQTGHYLSFSLHKNGR